MTARGLVADVRRIAVLRANALGDFVFILPALEALRAAYPAAEIVLLGRRWHAAFLANRPGPVDRVIPIPDNIPLVRPPEADGEEALQDLLQSLVREQFDLALQMHGGGRYSNPFVRSLGARITAGLRAPGAAALDRWVPYFYFQREILRYLEVASLVGAEPVGLSPRLSALPRDRHASFSVIPPSDRPLVVLHPGAGDVRRRWPAEKFASVGDALVAAGAEVVINGAGDALPAAAIARKAMRRPSEVWPHGAPLAAFTGLLARARLVVSNDSGPLHLAMAVGAATVGIYWCGNLINAGPMTCERHTPVLSWRLECPDCGRNCIADDCGHAVSFVADITVEEVIEAALELFHRVSENKMDMARNQNQLVD